MCVLGLRRHTVRLLPHNGAWAERFEEVKAQISSCTVVEAGRIHHVGSTAVPDLVAKPILDVDVALLPTEDIEEFVLRLEEVGYIDRGEGKDGIGRLLVLESEPDVRTVHVHVTPVEAGWWRQDVALRDALRADPELRSEYANLKSILARRFPNDRRSYRNAKSSFVEAVLKGLG